MKQYIYYTKVYNVSWAGIFRQHIYIIIYIYVRVCKCQYMYMCIYEFILGFNI